MKYSLIIELNYRTSTKEVSLADVPLSQRQMMEIAADYLNDPELASAVFTVLPIHNREEVSDD